MLVQKEKYGALLRIVIFRLDDYTLSIWQRMNRLSVAQKSDFSGLQRDIYNSLTLKMIGGAYRGRGA